MKNLTEEEKDLQIKLDKPASNEKEVLWTLSRLTNLMSRLPELYKSSQPEQKRRIMKLIIANLTMKQKNLEIIMKKPFQLMLEGPNSSIWGTLINKIYNYFTSKSYSITIFIEKIQSLELFDCYNKTG